MSSAGPIFLSASVPTKGRKGFGSADPYLIREAVSALVEVVLGRRLLVWGGHPAITPMIWESARQYGVSYRDVVQLYQSKYFEGQYPEENMRFDNCIETKAVKNDKPTSLLLMRRQMLSAHSFSAAVFIGGMEGVLEEIALFQELNPNAIIIPIPSPGGVSRDLFKQHPSLPSEFETAIDYSYWLYRLLEVDIFSPREFLIEKGG